MLVREDTQLLALENLVEDLFQGATISRYRAEKKQRGEERRIVNISDLQTLVTQGDLETETLTPGSYLSNALKPKDLAIATRGTILKASVISAEHAGAIAGQNLAVLKPKLALINPIYLAGVLRSGWMEAEFEKRSSRSTTIKLITLKQLGELPVPCPPLEKQATLAQLFLEVETLNDLAFKNVTTRRQLTEAAIQTLLGG